MIVEDEVSRVFDSGLNCAESLLLVVSKYTGLEKDSARFIPRVATGFGGGIARNGDMCGALSGAVMAISLALGRDRPDQSGDQCYTAIDQFYNDFVKAFGSSKCRELTHVDFKTPEGNAIYRERVHRERCTPIVEWAAKTASRIIKEKQTTN
ncbi:MAG: C-GCAxxG-C-C family protein [Candidatus Bathyarchaeia archaeon]|jgi:C_GCAxxG_C_C family probable redox protein